MAIKRTNFGDPAGAAATAAATVTTPNPAPTLYFYTASQATSTPSATLGVGTLRVIPFQVTRSLTIDRLGAEVSTVGEAGSKFRIGLYADTGAGFPGALLVDAGTINGDSATVQTLAITALTLAPGIYWSGGVVQIVTTTQPTIRCVATSYDPPLILAASTGGPPGSAGVAFAASATAVTGALPSTFPAGVPAGTSAPRILARVA